MVGLPLSHFAFPSSAHADNTIPNSYGGNPDGTGATRNDPITWWSKGSIAIGFAASAGYLTSNPNHKGTANGSSIAIGTLSNAAHYGSAAIGIGAASTRENQITLGATSTITGENGYTYAEAKKTTVTIPNLSGSSSELVAANEDGTLSRSGINIDSFKNLNCNSNGDSAVCYGPGSNADGDWSTSIGAVSSALKANSVALGYSAEAKAENSIAIGRDAETSNTDAIAIGHRAEA